MLTNAFSIVIELKGKFDQIIPERKNQNWSNCFSIAATAHKNCLVLLVLEGILAFNE